MARAWLNPDCAQGKHHACAGDAWDEDEDEAARCACPCHHQATGPTDPSATPLGRLLAMGVPYSLAVEALASTALDRAETHAVTGQPAWLQDDPDGYRIVDRD